MLIKICCTCKLPFENTNEFFPKHARRKDGLAARCHLCNRASSNAAYRDDPIKFRAAVNARHQNLLDRVRQLKTAPCTDCGNCFPPVCMDFDHLDESAKIGSVSRLVKKGCSWEMIQAEIDKCELVCANCHRIRTEGRQDGIPYLKSEKKYT